MGISLIIVKVLALIDPSMSGPGTGQKGSVAVLESVPNA